MKQIVKDWLQIKSRFCEYMLNFAQNFRIYGQ